MSMKSELHEKPLSRVTGVLLAAVLLLLPAAVRAQEMGDFTMEMLDGDLFTLGDYLGEKVIVITFFTYWCVPCAQEHPHLQRFYDEYGERGLLVVAISSDEPGDYSRVRLHVNRYHLSFPVVLDSDFSATRRYNPDLNFPLTMLVGRDRQIHHIYQSYRPGDELELEEDILALLDEEALQDEELLSLDEEEIEQPEEEPVPDEDPEPDVAP